MTTTKWDSWQVAFDKGLKSMDERNWTLTIEAFSDAEKIDASYADLHYFKAQAYGAANSF